MESCCSSHLISDGAFQEIISLDGGSHLSALVELIQSKHLSVDSWSSITKYDNYTVENESYAKAWHLSEQRIKTFLITHCHLDHIYGAVINSAMFGPQNPRTIVGLNYVIDTLKKHVFNNLLWPSLDKAGFINFQVVEPSMYTSLTTTLSILPFPVNHGSSFGQELKSSAFLFRNNLSDRYFLAFGDVEPDMVASEPLNIHIWRACSSLIAQRKLSHILIECSTPDIPDTLLFGHFCPRHLVNELCILQSLVQSYGVIMPTLTCLLTHLKSHPLQSANPADVILEQLESLSSKSSLSVTFKILQRGQFYKF